MKKLVSGLMLSTSVLGVAAPIVAQSTVFAETADTSTKTTEVAKPAQVILTHVTEGGKSLKANEVIAKDVKSGDRFSQEVTFSDITDDKGLVWEFKELKRVNRTTDSTSTDTKTSTSTTDTKTSTTDTKTSTTDTKTSTTDTKTSTTDTKTSTTDTKTSTIDTKTSTTDTKTSTTNTKTSTSTADTKTSTTDTKTSTTDTKTSTTDTKTSTTDTKTSTTDTKTSTTDTKTSTTDTKTSTSTADTTKPATTEANTTEKGGSVTIKYVDTEGKEIHKVVTDEIAGWPIGKTYDTTENKLSNIRFDGKDYVFKEVKGNEKGTITKDNQVVTYVYALKSGAGASTPTDTKTSTNTPDAKTDTTDTKSEDSSVKKTVSGTLTAGDNVYQAVYAPKMAKITYKFEGDLPKEVLAQLPKVNTKQVGSKFTVAKVQKETVKVGKVTYTFKGWDTSALNSDVKAEGEDAELEVPVLKVEADETPVYSGSTPSLTPSTNNTADTADSSTTDADKTDGTADTTDAEQPVEEAPVTALLTGDVTIVGTWDKTEDEPSGSLGSTSDKTNNSDADSNATTDTNADTNTGEVKGTDATTNSNTSQSNTQGTSNAVPSSNESAPAAKPTTFAKTGAKIAGGVFAAVAVLVLGLGSLFVVNRKKQK